MGRLVKFTKKFGAKGKGETAYYDPSLANQLVRVDKVAVYADKKGETDIKLSKERKEAIKKNVEKNIHAELEAKYIAEVEAEIRADESKELEAKVKAKIVEKLNPDKK